MRYIMPDSVNKKLDIVAIHIIFNGIVGSFLWIKGFKLKMDAIHL